jgi:hypothetical protein
MEPGVQFIEELLLLEVSDYHVLKFTDSLSNSILGNLQWGQSCYLDSSLLVCRVKGNMLDIQQLFTHSTIPDPPSRLQKYQLDALESVPTLRFIFKQPIVPNLDFLIEQETYTIYIATTDGSIYKLEFQQNIPFTFNNTEYLQGYSCYLVPNCSATSFCLLRQSKEAENIKDVVCLGTETGSYFVATLLSVENNDNIIIPSSIIQVDTPFNLVSKFTSFFRSATHERVLRVVNLKTSLLVTVSSAGMLRLWNSERLSLICELDIKVRDLTDIKIAKHAIADKKYLALSYRDAHIWTVSLFVVDSEEIKHHGDFLGRPGEEVRDIALGSKGLWIVWKAKTCRVSQYPFDNDKGGEVFTFEDSFEKHILEDAKWEENDDQIEYLMTRLTVPGRFNFSTINHAVSNVFEVADSILEETEYKETIYNIISSNTQPAQTLYAILQNCITQQQLSYDILSVSFSEDGSYTLPIILRDKNAIGIIRKPSCWIEKLSLASSKISTQFSSLSNNPDHEKIAEFKMKNEGKGLSIVLNSIRLWRLGFENRIERMFESCFYKGLQGVYDIEMPYHLQLLIARHLPNKWQDLIDKEIENTKQIIGNKDALHSKPASTYWAPFAVAIISRSVCTSVEAIYEYLLDLLLLTILSTKLSPSSPNPHTEILMHKLTGLVYPLFAVSKTIRYGVDSLTSSGFYSSCASIYNFPPNVSLALVYDRRESLLGQTSDFSFMNLSHWVHSSILRAIKLITFTVPLVSNTSSPYLLSFLVENSYPEAAVYFLSLMKEKNAGIVYLKGLAYMLLSDSTSASSELLTVDGLIDIDIDTSTKNNAEFYNGPWIRKDMSPLRDRSEFDIYSVYHSLLWKNVRYPDIRKSVIVGSLMTCSQTDLEEKLYTCFMGLVEVGDFPNAMTCVMDMREEERVKECLQKFVEAVYNTACVSALVSVPFTPYHKDLIDEILKRKSELQHFDLHRTISAKQHQRRASELFKDILDPEDRTISNKISLDWHTLRYAFSLRNFDYKQAAESMFRQYKSILAFLETSDLPIPEVEFLMSLIKESLLLTTICLRSLPRDEAFIVYKKLKRTSGMKRDSMRNPRAELEEYEKGELITLGDIENLLFTKIE